MAHPTRRMYQRWQANLFRSGWFARTFYETMGRFATPIYEWAYELMAPDIQTAPRIADVGCGNALMSVRVARDIVNRDFTLIDASAAQIEAGRNVIMEIAAHHRVRSFAQPAEQNPLPDAAVDLLYSTGSINLWTDPVAGLRHCKRVTADGGIVWIFDQAPCDTPGLAFDAIFVKRVFGLGVPGYSIEEVQAFAREAGLGEGTVHADQSLYGLRFEVTR